MSHVFFLANFHRRPQGQRCLPWQRGGTGAPQWAHAPAVWAPHGVAVSNARSWHGVAYPDAQVSRGTGASSPPAGRPSSVATTSPKPAWPSGDLSVGNAPDEGASDEDGSFAIELTPSAVAFLQRSEANRLSKSAKKARSAATEARRAERQQQQHVRQLAEARHGRRRAWLESADVGPLAGDAAPPPGGGDLPLAERISHLESRLDAAFDEHRGRAVCTWPQLELE
ncbi:hypothetical protein H696_05682 [Fonticula alba]|uniref:Uncharacterized protein n=1 Tax=Fonticula alba TaxID=691883 RepID=A0A058Z1H6_FONAL|nr:hypothetical protein H696_05682 [Fonticula alba]KCV67956.1 hypothetical protein H696_05682 [Fonticula alba]|eukprot:XP_009497776.1 hypothetical protein H696_05682 [Fonticula alba]